ncbi:HDIG domain-containing metalloprotein [Collinsella stercoris]|uniref:HDIG domain-containing metalloprotein n=1 Tax=Collinsella stercoris TaxID=147206 RepID=UPI0026F087CE|nr:HDIG domain-containing metalloprotein [Collinsella stercoris]MBS6555643.1 HDIG domain-containing protein [Collinsella stercoris]
MRQTCLDAFNSYVARYDASDERIALKVEHTYEVTELCDEIARGEGLPPADVDLAWLCGLLHDIGRFEQLRQWGTFSDADSCSHAALGIQVLKDEMGSFTRDPEWAHIIERAVALHSDFRLPSDLGARERLFCTITRDDDKVDILRVFNQSSCGAVLGIDPDEFSR